MHVIFDTIVEELVHHIRLLYEWLTSLLAVLFVHDFHFIAHSRQFFRWVNVGNHTSIEHVLNVFKESLVNDVVV